MTYEQRFADLLENYAARLREEERRRKPGDGLLGFGKKLSDAPCHAEYDRAVEALAGELAAQGDAPKETAALVWAIFRADERCDWPVCAEWMLLAAHRHAALLVPCLDREDARALHAWYARRFPPLQRMPAQKALLKALVRRAEGK